jgi:hypothetical protein
MSNSDAERELLSAIHEHMDELLRRTRPDYTIVVYCDQHLGVQMRLTELWTLGQYGEAAADANTLIIWSCPKPGCGRCYEPLMFGYYANAMGSRIEHNADEQPRCSHERPAFMYIGKCKDSPRCLGRIEKRSAKAAQRNEYLHLVRFSVRFGDRCRITDKWGPRFPRHRLHGVRQPALV